MGFIDAHTHVWTQDFDQYPIHADFSPEDMKPPTFTPWEMFSHCTASDVDRVVLIQMSFYKYDNSYMLDTIAQWPEIFRGVAIVDRTRPDLADEMRRLREGGVRGFRICPDGADPQGWLSEGEYGPMLSAAADLDMAICPLIDPEYLPAVGSACDRRPGVNFVVDHLSRIGADGPIQQQHLDALCDLASCPSCFVKVSAFYALGEKTPPHRDLIPMIKQVYEAFGAGRLMWASDCPYQVDNETYEDGLSLVRDHLDFLTDDECEMMLAGTAQGLFFAD